VADDNELLVVRAASPHSLIEQHFPACLSDLDGETPIVLRTEREPIAVGNARAAEDVSTTSAQICHECRDRRPVIGYALVSVSSPVGEAHLLIGPETRDGLRLGEQNTLANPIHQERRHGCLRSTQRPWPTNPSRSRCRGCLVLRVARTSRRGRILKIPYYRTLLLHPWVARSGSSTRDARQAAVRAVRRSEADAAGGEHGDGGDGHDPRP